jgi:hypothetical protein
MGNLLTESKSSHFSIIWKPHKLLSVKLGQGLRKPTSPYHCGENIEIDATVESRDVELPQLFSVYLESDYKTELICQNEISKLPFRVETKWTVPKEFLASQTTKEANIVFKFEKSKGFKSFPIAIKSVGQCSTNIVKCEWDKDFNDLTCLLEINTDTKFENLRLIGAINGVEVRDPIISLNPGDPYSKYLTFSLKDIELPYKGELTTRVLWKRTMCLDETKKYISINDAGTVEFLEEEEFVQASKELAAQKPKEDEPAEVKEVTAEDFYKKEPFVSLKKALVFAWADMIKTVDEAEEIEKLRQSLSISMDDHDKIELIVLKELAEREGDDWFSLETAAVPEEVKIGDTVETVESDVKEIEWDSEPKSIDLDDYLVKRELEKTQEIKELAEITNTISSTDIGLISNPLITNNIKLSSSNLSTKFQNKIELNVKLRQKKHLEKPFLVEVRIQKKGGSEYEVKPPFKKTQSTQDKILDVGPFEWSLDKIENIEDEYRLLIIIIGSDGAVDKNVPFLIEK